MFCGCISAFLCLCIIQFSLVGANHILCWFCHLINNVRKYVWLRNMLYLEFVTSGQFRSKNSLFERSDWVPCLPHLLDFLPGSVAGARVRHGMTTVPICHGLQDQWALSSGTVVYRELGSFTDCQDIHAINLWEHT